MLGALVTTLPFFSGLIEDLTAVSLSSAIITRLFNDCLIPPLGAPTLFWVLTLDDTVDAESFGFEFI